MAHKHGSVENAHSLPIRGSIRVEDDLIVDGRQSFLQCFGSHFSFDSPLKRAASFLHERKVIRYLLGGVNVFYIRGNELSVRCFCIWRFVD